MNLNANQEYFLQLLLQGEMEPAEAAARFQIGGDFARHFINQMDELILNQLNAGEMEGQVLIRMSRFNHLLSENAGDSFLIAQTAFTLFQLLWTNVNTLQEGIFYLDKALPELEAANPSNELICRIHFMASLAYFNFNNIFSIHSQRVITLAEKTLSNPFAASVLDGEMKAQLYYLLGTTYNSLPEQTVEALQASMPYLETAVKFYRASGDNQRLGSSLNNLGNSCLQLGLLEKDVPTLEKALQLFRDAIPFRSVPGDLNRTQNNIVKAEKAIQALSTGDVAAMEHLAPQKRGISEAGLYAGERIMKYLNSVTDDAERELYSRQALEKFMEAVANSRNAAEPQRVRARAELGLGILLNTGDFDLGSYLGICYLKSAERTLVNTGDEEKLADLYFRMGLSLIIIFDENKKHPFISSAIRYFEKAVPIMEKRKETMALKQCVQMLIAAYRMMLEERVEDPDIRKTLKTWEEKLDRLG